MDRKSILKSVDMFPGGAKVLMSKQAARALGFAHV